MQEADQDMIDTMVNIPQDVVDEEKPDNQGMTFAQIPAINFEDNDD